MKQHNIKKRSAFTLIELLVVIAIIAILAAILFPVFAQAKAAAKQAVTVSNLKQIDLAMQMYTSDNDDTFPLTRWHDSVTHVPYNYKHATLPYHKSKDMFHDMTNPAAALPDCEGDVTCNGGIPVNLMAQPVFPRGYFYYRSFLTTNNWQDQSPYISTAVQNSANSILISESKDIPADYGPWQTYCLPGAPSGSVNFCTGWTSYSNWGGGHRDDHGFVVGFVDGHAKFENMRVSCGPNGTTGNIVLNQWQYDRNNLPTDAWDSNPGTLGWVDTFCSSLPF